MFEDGFVRPALGARRNPLSEAAILDAAAALIAEQGYAKLTIEAVAKRAHAGKATIYRWWPSRGHLLLALYSRAKTGLPEPDTGDFAQDLTEYLSAMLAQWRGDSGPAQAETLRLIIAEAQTDPTMAKALAEERRTNWHHIDRIIFRANFRGDLNPALTPERAEQRVISMLWYLLLTGQVPSADQVPALVADLMAGLAA